MSETLRNNTIILPQAIDFMAPWDGLLGATRFALRVALAGDHRRYAALSNRACLGRRFELGSMSNGRQPTLLGVFFQIGSPGRIRTADQRINRRIAAAVGHTNQYSVMLAQVCRSNGTPDLGSSKLRNGYVGGLCT
jgi:hypothetical protein